MGLYDQPALWKYVMEKTGQEKIIYIGHSQGTCQMFVAMCEHTEFFKKHMLKFVAIAPVLRVSNLNSPAVRRLIKDEIAYKALKKMGPLIMS